MRHPGESRDGRCWWPTGSGRRYKFFAALALAMMAGAAHADPAEDIRTVAALDTAYQAAVERNDAETMAAIRPRPRSPKRGEVA